MGCEKDGLSWYFGGRISKNLKIDIYNMSVLLLKMCDFVILMKCFSFSVSGKFWILSSDKYLIDLKLHSKTRVVSKNLFCTKSAVIYLQES